MKTVIFYTSTHHGNTEKVAKVIGDVLGAEMHNLENEDGSRLDISKYDLIGLGSGIYRFTFSPKLFEFVNRFDLKEKRVFLFSTCASGRLVFHRKLTEALALKQAKNVGEFTCPGFIDWAFFKWFGGGLRKGQPNEEDLENARKFAESLKKIVG
jgi:flavodoxin